MPKQRRKIVISVHGIESQGVWQKDLAPLISEQGWIYYPLHYGIFRGYRFIQPWQRTKKVEWLRGQIEQITGEHDPVVPSLIAHSLGTFIISEVLDIYPAIKLDKIILCGSIIHQEYDWAKIFRQQQATKVRNDFAKKDWVAGIARCFAAHTGPSGRDGFLKTHDLLKQDRFPRYLHSSAFTRSHYSEYWIPFLNERLAYEGATTPVSIHEETVGLVEAARWSAITYYRQYIMRVVDAFSRNEVFDAKAETPLPARKLQVLLPARPGEADQTARRQYAKDFGFKEARLGVKPDTRSANYCGGEVLYDIPSTVHSLTCLEKRNAGELMEAVTEFERHLYGLITADDSPCKIRGQLIVEIVKTDTLPAALK